MLLSAKTSPDGKLAVWVVIERLSSGHGIELTR